MIISSLDAERLEKLIESLPRNTVPGKDDLEAELTRAEVVDPKEVPPTVVTMNSTVRFEVESSLEEFCLTLVYPKDLDGSGEKISILAPVGSARFLKGTRLNGPSRVVGCCEYASRKLRINPNVPVSITGKRITSRHEGAAGIRPVSPHREQVTDSCSELLGDMKMRSQMEVKIVTFPETKVASITHLGPPEQEHVTAGKLIEWKIEHRLLDQTIYRSYGLHYADPRTVDPLQYRVEFCLSIDGTVGENGAGIVEKVIPRLRCAFARDVGSRANNLAAKYLVDEWLPESGEELSDFPLIFHYVNVGPSVTEDEAVTDVYLPLK